MHDPWFLVVVIQPLIPVLVIGYQGAQMIWKGQLIERLAQQVDYRVTPFRHDYVFDEVKLFPFAMLIKTATGDTDVNVRIEFQIAAEGVQRTEDANHEPMLFSKILQGACRQFAQLL